MAIHQTEVLHQTKRGYTLWCTSCRDIQVGFGNMLLVHSLKGFRNFKDYVDGLQEDSTHFESPLNRNIYIRMAGMDFGYCLSGKELLELKELLDLTMGAISVKGMIEQVLQEK